MADKKPALALIFGKSKGPPPGDDAEQESDGPTDEFRSAYREYQDIEDDPQADDDAKAEAFWAAVKACVNGGY